MKPEPIIVDFFGGRGGATKGYQRAGWKVYAVDLDPRTLRQNPATGTFAGDALLVLTMLLMGESLPFSDGRALSLEEIDGIHTSPPCQGYSISTAGNPKARAKHTRLIAATRDLLVQTGKPYVIENVELAKKEMVDPIMLCGRQFGLQAIDEDGEWLYLDRHRMFETNWHLPEPVHEEHDPTLQVAGVYGGSRRAKRNCPPDSRGRNACKTLPCEHESYASLAPRDRHAAKYERGGGYVPRSVQVRQTLLGIDWMTNKGMEESIPPVYATYVGEHMMNHLLTS